MPAYDYRCQACANVFEKTQRITEPAGATCPKCGGSECQRIITGGTFHLKGSGWYASDYKAKSAEPGASASGEGVAGKGDAAPAESSAPAKNDAKTDAKTDAGSGSADATKAPAASAPSAEA